MSLVVSIYNCKWLPGQTRFRNYRKTSDRSPRLLSVQVTLTPGMYPGLGFYPRFYGNYYVLRWTLNLLTHAMKTDRHTHTHTHTHRYRGRERMTDTADMCIIVSMAYSECICRSRVEAVRVTPTTMLWHRQCLGCQECPPAICSSRLLTVSTGPIDMCSASLS